jgi:hypothetical protein
MTTAEASIDQIGLLMGGVHGADAQPARPEQGSLAHVA